MAPLPDDVVAERLRDLPGWEREGDQIVRTFRLPGFPEAVGFVDRVAVLAEAADHHPDIDIRWRDVRLVLSTHSDGGITDKDFSLAAEIDDTAAPGG
ncbi:MAG: 4a-hydroxytetrahydrobiopterin dehydratase [Acidimicrobiia bacterium]